ncbi:hypothetical protein [Pararhizobium sp. O133]|uniref:hypothetical protein n=1 Tax=Pararhizobium sp. O133 TaxID=3449278 RepID=UPI003F6883F9
MNKIVREHYPVSSLPDDLREGLSLDAEVRIVIEVAEPEQDKEHFSGFVGFELPERVPMTAQEAVEAIRRYKALGRPSVDPDEAVSRIRKLRDEWDDE